MKLPSRLRVGPGVGLTLQYWLRKERRTIRRETALAILPVPTNEINGLPVARFPGHDSDAKRLAVVGIGSHHVF
jgi:hypothetical protein